MRYRTTSTFFFRPIISNSLRFILPLLNLLIIRLRHILYSQTTDMRSLYHLPFVLILKGISSDTIGFSNFSCSGISFSVRLYSINKRVMPAAAAFASPSLPNAVADSFRFISLRNFSNILSFFVFIIFVF